MFCNKCKAEIDIYDMCSGNPEYLNHLKNFGFNIDKRFSIICNCDYFDLPNNWYPIRKIRTDAEPRPEA